MVSENITRRRDEYMEVMHAHRTKSRAEIIESVRETQEQLLSLFSSRAAEEALRKPAADEWCLRELALHSMFTERLVGKLVHYMSRGSLPPPEDLQGAGIGMMPKNDDREYNAILSDLREANAALLDAIRDLPEEPNVEFLVPHPFFGPLNCLEWAGFERVHDTDHIQHAQTILAGMHR